MESTILQKTLEVIGDSLLSNITWELLKRSGKSLITSFKNRFKDYFKNDQEAENCLESIAVKSCISEKYPFDDVENVYRNCTDKRDTDFQVQFKDWLISSMDDFKSIVQNQGNVQSVHYEKIEASTIGSINAFVIGKS